MIDKVSNQPDNYPNFHVDGSKLYKHLPSFVYNNSNVSDWKLVIPIANQKTTLRQMLVMILRFT